jgi:hypothetical protein
MPSIDVLGCRQILGAWRVGALAFWLSHDPEGSGLTSARQLS